MKAAVLTKGGSPLEIQMVDEPLVHSSGIKVQVEYAMVPSFTGVVLSGNMPFPLPVPYIPGPSCVGVIEETGTDVFGFVKGQRVFCSPYFTSTINGVNPEKILVGWFGLTPGSGSLMEHWKNGAFSEKAVYPAACVTPLGSGAPEELVKLGNLSISYGGLLKGEFKAGQTLFVNGASGVLGGGIVMVALAMGASCIYAAGRNSETLEKICSLDPRRVKPVQLQEDKGSYEEQIKEQAGNVDLMIDALGYVDSPELTSAAISQVQPDGTAVFMGGVLADISINYLQILASQITVRGSFMHPPEAVSQLLAMNDAGLLPLEKISSVVMPLEEINQAIHKAAECRGLGCCMVTPMA